MINFGLRNKKTGKLLGYEVKSNGNDAEFCNESTVYLEENDGNIWTCDSPKHAEYVRQFSTEWYNSSIRSPVNNYDAEDLEIVKFETVITPVKDVKIPTMREYLTRKYSKSDPKHLKYMLTLLDKNGVGHYSLYDLNELEGDL